VRYGVTSGVVGKSLVNNTWYDQAGNTIKRMLAGSNAFASPAFDTVTLANRKPRCDV